MATEPKNIRCLCGQLLGKRQEDGAVEVRARHAATVRAQALEVDCPRCGVTVRVEPQPTAPHEMRVLVDG